MTFRIIAEREKTADVVRVYGRLVGKVALEEFLHACQPAEAALVIDLTDLRLADEEALSALRSLRQKGVRLRGVSPYISLLLGS